MDEREKEKKRKEKEAQKSQPSQHYESYQEREKRVNAIKAKFPWTKLQKYSLALCKYLAEVSTAIAKHILERGPRNAVAVTLAAKVSHDFGIRIGRSLPSFAKIASGAEIDKKHLAAFWVSALGKEPGLKPHIDWEGRVEHVPLDAADLKLIKDLEELAAVWKVKIPKKPQLSEFSDTKEQKPAPPEKKSTTPKASDLEKIRTGRIAKRGKKTMKARKGD